MYGRGFQQKYSIEILDRGILNPQLLEYATYLSTYQLKFDNYCGLSEKWCEKVNLCEF